MSKVSYAYKPNDPTVLYGIGSTKGDPATSFLKALSVKGVTDDGIDFWHPDLPEVQTLGRGPGPRRIYSRSLAARTKDKIASRLFPAWKPVVRKAAIAILSLLLPAIAQAEEPCKVNVATCTSEQCAYLPGIGPAKGAAIEAAHPADEAALDAVPGIGEATLAKILPHVTYTGETTCTSKQTTPKPEAGKDGAK